MPFSFVVLFSALSMAMLARHLRTGRPLWLAGYALVLALAAYSNTLAPFLLVPVHAVLVVPAGRAAVRRLVVAIAGAAVLAAPVRRRSRSSSPAGAIRSTGCRARASAASSRSPRSS